MSATDNNPDFDPHCPLGCYDGWIVRASSPPDRDPCPHCELWRKYVTLTGLLAEVVADRSLYWRRPKLFARLDAFMAREDAET